MASKQTTWGPDTCGCRVTYEWDDAVDATLRTHTIVAVEKKCDIHSVIPDQLLYETLLNENRRKNLTFGIARVELQRPIEDRGEWYSWGFTSARLLEITFLGIVVPQSAKTRIQNLCDLQFGPGKVKIN